MENCLFCKIIKGEIPSTKVYEDEEILAFKPDIVFHLAAQAIVRVAAESPVDTFSTRDSRCKRY